MLTSLQHSADVMQDETNTLSGSPSTLLVTALGAASLTLWLWLAFLRTYGTTGILFAGLAFAALLAALTLTSFTIARSVRNGSLLLRRELAQCSLAFTLLLLFIPEYASRVHPPALRSALLLGIFSGLWLVLCRSRYSEAVGAEASASYRIGWSIAGALALLGGLTYFAIKKFYVFGYVGQDLAYFAQIMHTTLHGHLFWGSLLQDLLYSHSVTTDFAGHNSPIMFLFLPFYAVFPSPITLLVVRNIAMLACVYPVYRIAKLSVSDSSARLWAAAFVLLPVITYQCVFDFYPLSVAALPLLFTLLFYLEGRFQPFIVNLVLTLLVREDLALFAIALALVALVQRKGLRWIGTPLVAGAAWGALSYLVILPHALQGASFVTDACFSHLGATPAEMLTHVCSSPQTTVLAHGNIVYLKQLLTPTGLLLSFGSPLVIASLPFLAINLLAGAGKCITTIIYAQYSVVPATVLFVSALLFSAERKGRLERWVHLGLPGTHVSPLIAIALSLATLTFVTGKAQLAEITAQPWGEEAHQVANMIPVGASLAAPRYMLPALANRDCLYQTHRLYQYHHAVYEYLILDKNWEHIDAAPEYEAAYRELLRTAPADSRFHVMYESPAFLVLQDPSMHNVSCFPVSQGQQP